VSDPRAPDHMTAQPRARPVIRRRSSAYQWWCVPRSRAGRPCRCRPAISRTSAHENTGLAPPPMGFGNSA
jgi:hypothetical protein